MTDPARKALIVEREMPHPPEKIWRALTEGPLMEQWLLKNDFEPVVGRRFNLRSTPLPNWNGVVDCEVVAIELHRRLVYSWAVGQEATGGLKTVVTWTLTPTTGGTHVRMEQSGFRPEAKAAYGGATYGWKLFFEGLERVLAGLK